MKPILLLLLTLPVLCEDFERFKLKDGRELDGEYRNGSIVMADGAMSVAVKLEDIVARAPKERPVKPPKPERPKGEPPKVEPTPEPEKVAPSGAVTLTQLKAMQRDLNADGTKASADKAVLLGKNWYANFIRTGSLDPIKAPGAADEKLKEEVEAFNVSLTALMAVRAHPYGSGMGDHRGYYNGGLQSVLGLESMTGAYAVYVKDRGEPKAGTDKPPIPPNTTP